MSNFQRKTKQIIDFPIYNNNSYQKYVLIYGTCMNQFSYFHSLSEAEMVEIWFVFSYFEKVPDLPYRRILGHRTLAKSYYK